MGKQVHLHVRLELTLRRLVTFYEVPGLLFVCLVPHPRPTPHDNMISDPFMLNTFFLGLFFGNDDGAEENYVSEEASARKIGRKMLCMRTQESAKGKNAEAE